MLPHVSPAVYKCIKPVDTSFTTSPAVYHAPLNRPKKKTARKLPFPAWPEIEEADQPLCFPMLMRATYSHYQAPREEPEVVATRIEEYLSRPGIMAPEAREQLRAYTDSYKNFSMRSGIDTLPYILSDTLTVCRDMIKETINVIPVIETLTQAFIYGNLGNFYGEWGAFTYTHEFGHRLAGGCHSGVVQEGLSHRAHNILDQITTTILSPEQITELWAQFEQTNKQIEHFAQKFEAIEEIFATYLGIRFLPTEVRNRVVTSVEESLKANNWYKGYEALARFCDNSDDPSVEAFITFDFVCRMLEQSDIDSTQLLYTYSELQEVIWSSFFEILEEKDIDPEEFRLEDFPFFWHRAELRIAEEINRILEQVHIPRNLYWTNSKTLYDRSIPMGIYLDKAIINNDLSGIGLFAMFEASTSH